MANFRTNPELAMVNPRLAADDRERSSSMKSSPKEKEKRRRRGGLSSRHSQDALPQEPHRPAVDNSSFDHSHQCHQLSTVCHVPITFDLGGFTVLRPKVPCRTKVVVLDRPQQVTKQDHEQERPTRSSVDIASYGTHQDEASGTASPPERSSRRRRKKLKKDDERDDQEQRRNSEGGEQQQPPEVTRLFHREIDGAIKQSLVDVSEHWGVAKHESTGMKLTRTRHESRIGIDVLQPQYALLRNIKYGAGATRRRSYPGAEADTLVLDLLAFERLSGEPERKAGVGAPQIDESEYAAAQRYGMQHWAEAARIDIEVQTTPTVQDVVKHDMHMQTMPIPTPTAAEIMTHDADAKTHGGTFAETKDMGMQTQTPASDSKATACTLLTSAPTVPEKSEEIRISDEPPPQSKLLEQPVESSEVSRPIAATEETAEQYWRRILKVGIPENIIVEPLPVFKPKEPENESPPNEELVIYEEEEPEIEEQVEIVVIPHPKKQVPIAQPSHVPPVKSTVSAIQETRVNVVSPGKDAEPSVSRTQVQPVQSKESVAQESSVDAQRHRKAKRSTSKKQVRNSESAGSVGHSRSEVSSTKVAEVQEALNKADPTSTSPSTTQLRQRVTAEPGDHLAFTIQKKGVPYGEESQLLEDLLHGAPPIVYAAVSLLHAVYYGCGLYIICSIPLHILLWCVDVTIRLIEWIGSPTVSICSSVFARLFRLMLCPVAYLFQLMLQMWSLILSLCCHRRDDEQKAEAGGKSALNTIGDKLAYAMKTCDTCHKSKKMLFIFLAHVVLWSGLLCYLLFLYEPSKKRCDSWLDSKHMFFPQLPTCASWAFSSSDALV